MAEDDSDLDNSVEIVKVIPPKRRREVRLPKTEPIEIIVSEIFVCIIVCSLSELLI